MQRREYLTALGSAATAGLAVTGSVAATHPREQPAHVSLSYSSDMLRGYVPRLVLTDVSERPTLYGWRASSPEYDTDCYVYWAEYSHQDGVSEYDSHYGDHEPVYVFVDSDTGDISDIVYSAYHWLRGSWVPPDADHTQHATLHVVSPWHHYYPEPESAIGRELSVFDLDSVFQSWLDNGLEEDLAPGTVVNPWIMRTRDSWWRRTFGGFSLRETYLQILRAAGVHREGGLL